MEQNDLKAIAIGEVADEPKASETKTGKSVVSTNIKTSRAYVRLTFWEEMAPTGKALKKGDVIEIEGFPRVDTYTKQDGSTVAKLAITVNKCTVKAKQVPF